MSKPKWDIFQGDCREVMRGMPDASVDACVTDPPYELRFMGCKWDSSGISYSIDVWREVLRVLKPGAHLLAFGGTRTVHRIACAIEDAGFEIRDTIFWLYGQGFPKSLDVSKAIDKEAGAEREILGESPYNSRRPNPPVSELHKQAGHKAYLTEPSTDAAKQWQGWGTALKPAVEPIILARKPLSESTVAANVLEHETGAINVDGCRIDGAPPKVTGRGIRCEAWRQREGRSDIETATLEWEQPSGRWPANVILDEEAAEMLDEQSGELKAGGNLKSGNHYARMGYNFADGQSNEREFDSYGDTGGASRFFFCAKATQDERKGGNHPTVKPVALMRYLVRLVTPPNGTILDPFTGTGKTGEAAVIEGFSFVGIELDAEHATCAKARIGRALGVPVELPKGKAREKDLPLFNV